MAKGDITALDLETEPEIRAYWLPNQTHLQNAIHETHAQERDRAIEVLFGAPNPTLKRQAIRMADCARYVDLYIDPDAGQLRRYTSRCKSRLCPYCARKRSQHVARQMEDLVRPMKRPRHLVLTVKSQPTDLRQQCKDLRTWFNKLRKVPWVAAAIVRGVYTMEITINPRTGLWHPHLHIIYDGEYMPQKRLRINWHTITGGSDIVWIEPVEDRLGACRELCKYIGKPQDSEHWTDVQLLDYANAIARTRMVQTFGKKSPFAVNDDFPNLQKPTDLWTISLVKICWLIDQNESAAARLALLIADRWPDLGRYINQRFNMLCPDVSKHQKFLRAHQLIAAGPGPPRPELGKRPTPAELEAEMLPLLASLREAAKADMNAWQRS